MRCKSGDTCLIVGGLEVNRYASVEITQQVGNGWHFKNPSRPLTCAPGHEGAAPEDYVLRDSDLMPITEAMVRPQAQANP
jgi:hypothetical protein